MKTGDSINVLDNSSGSQSDVDKVDGWMHSSVQKDACRTMNVSSVSICMSVAKVKQTKYVYSNTNLTKNMAQPPCIHCTKVLTSLFLQFWGLITHSQYYL